MNAFWQAWGNHPASTIFYFIYLVFMFISIKANIAYNIYISAPNHGPTLAQGEGLMFGLMFMTMIAVIFLFVTLVNMSGQKSSSKFYSWLCLGIIAPVVLLFYTANLQE